MRLSGLIATAVITAIVHMLSYPVPGVFIAVPVFVPPVATALVALLLARENAVALAYVSGSLGTLIGADLLNLDAVRGARRVKQLNATTLRKAAPAGSGGAGGSPMPEASICVRWLRVASLRNSSVIRASMAAGWSQEFR
jgi:hypothetical protein